MLHCTPLFLKHYCLHIILQPANLEVKVAWVANPFVDGRVNDIWC